MSRIYTDASRASSAAQPFHSTSDAFRKVLVVTGGEGPEREGSLISGAHAADGLRELGFECEVRDLSELTHQELRDHDVAFLAIHGWYGEDGKLQGILDLAGIPYTGSGVAASAVAMHKPLCNRIAESAGLHVPAWVELDERQSLAAQGDAVFRKLGNQVFVKPASGGGSIGAGVVTDNAGLQDQVCAAVAAHGHSMLASRRVDGADVTVGIVEAEGELRVLPPLATYVDSEFYDYATKHDPALRRHECPARFSEEALGTLREHSTRAFRAVGCRGYARVDFLVDADERPWFLEINTLPGLSRMGNLATMAVGFGWSYERLIDHVLSTAMRRPRYLP
jgi:D-alanine-D-alanine ligase